MLCCKLPLLLHGLFLCSQSFLQGFDLRSLLCCDLLCCQQRLLVCSALCIQPCDLLTLPCRGCALYCQLPLQIQDLLSLLHNVLPLHDEALVVC